MQHFSGISCAIEGRTCQQTIFSAVQQVAWVMQLSVKAGTSLQKGFKLVEHFELGCYLNCTLHRCWARTKKLELTMYCDISTQQPGLEAAQLSSACV